MEFNRFTSSIVPLDNGGYIVECAAAVGHTNADIMQTSEKFRQMWPPSISWKFAAKTPEEAGELIVKAMTELLEKEINRGMDDLARCLKEK